MICRSKTVSGFGHLSPTEPYGRMRRTIEHLSTDGIHDCPSVAAHNLWQQY